MTLEKPGPRRALRVPPTTGDTGSGDERQETLRDGATVRVRQLGLEDYDAVVLLTLSLTERERYLRFFTAHPRFLDEWAHSVTEAAEPNRCTVGAFEDDSLLGLATYVGTDRPRCAEVAVVVAHDQHDRGVGTLLLHALAQRARHNGFHHLVGDVLAENPTMSRLVADAGWPTRRNRHGATLTYDVDLDGLG